MIPGGLWLPKGYISKLSAAVLLSEGPHEETPRIPDSPQVGPSSSPPVTLAVLGGGRPLILSCHLRLRAHQRIPPTTWGYDMGPAGLLDDLCPPPDGLPRPLGGSKT